ncbi:DNA methyltransferase [Psychrobacter sp. T6-6]|uniref:DNA methyltransferase n=1 Tax=Psychrobacter sp. T6-6 TaxID=3457452 RepID=UPI003FD396A6
MAVNQANILDSLDKICRELNINEFFYDFLLAYGLPKSTVTRLRKEDDNRNVADGDGIALKKKIYFKKVSIGDDIEAIAEEIKSSNVISQHDIRFVMVTDFQTLVAYDLKAEERLETTIEALPQQYAFFLPLAGYEKAIMHSEHPADIRASEKMGQLFDLIKARNDLTTPEDIHALNVFLTRLLFCFYAEDTGIFAEGQMTSAIQSSTQIDGSDLAHFFSDLFKVLNLDNHSPERKDMPAHFQAFPYVNGGLFQTDEPTPEFGRQARRILIDCGTLDWSQINPDIFGSMFQAVIDEEHRANLAQHYTSVPNIMKVIQPLFLDTLYEVLENTRDNETKLKSLLVRLQNIRIFDPACGSGNFLIIAYKELRKLEMEVIDALNATSKQSVIYYTNIRLSQFYGIELDDFAHEITVLSLWLAEHQMNQVFKEKFGYTEPALPLRESGHIVVGNSLTVDWNTVCPRENEKGVSHEIYVCGNPPFLGYRYRTDFQNKNMDFVFHGFKKHRFLDYVSCWFWKATNYMDNKLIECAFVSTNSICQGEQVGMLWPFIISEGVRIKFAYNTFPWKNSAKNNAAVHVIIIGLTKRPGFAKLFKHDDDALMTTVHTNINPYLVGASNIIITSSSKPLTKQIPIALGNYLKDGGGLILTENEKNKLLSESPLAERWVRLLIGAEEMLNGTKRWCLWFEGEKLESLINIPFIAQRLEQVENSRLASTKIQTRLQANTPHLFSEVRQPSEGSYLLIPTVSSERRKYIPIGFYNSQDIVVGPNFLVANATLFEFAILTSEMHNDWMRAVAGRLESRYRYSSTLVYNTFPWPIITAPKRQNIEGLAEEVLLIREDYPNKTLAELYDPDKMPAPLIAAHKALDAAVEKLYRDTPFRDAEERLTHLFGRYEKLIAKEKVGATAKKKAKRTK